MRRATSVAVPSAPSATGSSGVLELVRTEGADKRSTARFLAFGVNGLSVALMIVVFAHTAGVTGAEVGIAGGSAVLGQKLLEAVFGDQAVRTLAERAAADLHERCPGPVRVRASPLHRPPRRPRALVPGTADTLRDAARRVDDLRFAAQSSPVLGGAAPAVLTLGRDLACGWWRHRRLVTAYPIGLTLH